MYVYGGWQCYTDSYTYADSYTYVDTYTYTDTGDDPHNTGDGRNDYSDPDADSHNTGFGYIYRRNRGRL